jgi:hypothetical protein
MYLASNQTLNSIKLWLAETYEFKRPHWMSYANGAKLNLEELAILRRVQQGGRGSSSTSASASHHATQDGHNRTALLSEIRQALQDAPTWRLLKALALLEEHAASAN